MRAWVWNNFVCTTTVEVMLDNTYGTFFRLREDATPTCVGPPTRLCGHHPFDKELFQWEFDVTRFDSHS